MPHSLEFALCLPGCPRLIAGATARSTGFCIAARPVSNPSLWLLAVPPAARSADMQIRIEGPGHADQGVSAAVIQEPKERNTALDLNPTSNVRTGACSSFAAHPLRRLFDAGLLVTLNSDDPAFFGSDLANEYLQAHSERAQRQSEASGVNGSLQMVYS